MYICTLYLIILKINFICPSLGLNLPRTTYVQYTVQYLYFNCFTTTEADVLQHKRQVIYLTPLTPPQEFTKINLTPPIKCSNLVHINNHLNKIVSFSVLSALNK